LQFYFVGFIEDSQFRREPGERKVPFLIIVTDALMSNAVTLKDLARAAGVSVMTVSRALRNQSHVAPETQRRIQDLARAMAYRPNPLVSALMTYRRRGRSGREVMVVGFVTSFSTRDGWREVGINRDFYDGVQEGAQRHGYRVDPFWLREQGMSARRLSQILYNRNVRGLIIAPLPVGLGHLRLDWDRFSAVALGYSLAWPDLHRAANHQFRSMRLAMRRLRKRGHHRIGLALRASINERVSHHWVGGYLSEQYHDPGAEELAPLIPPDREWNQSTFERWYLRYRPSVVLSQHEEILEWLGAMGVEVPEEVGFVHLNCPDQSRTYAGIYQNAIQVGSSAVDFLVGMVQRNELGVPALAHSLLIDGTWQEGATLHPVVNPNQLAKKKRPGKPGLLRG
jgi:DNA-binding LacI/PurR family transcriptional regulator